MEDRKLEIIKQLMDELEGMMQPEADELGARLGRPKSVEIEVEGGDPGLESEEENLGMDLDGDEEMGEDPEHRAMVLGSPEEKLKSRIMKMRG